jgi:hypothetical protein
VLGLPLKDEDAYLRTGVVDGVNEFAAWPLSHAAESCFGEPEWPSEVPVPQGWIEFDVEDIESATLELEERGYKLLVSRRMEPWGQVVTWLLGPGRKPTRGGQEFVDARTMQHDRGKVDLDMARPVPPALSGQLRRVTEAGSALAALAECRALHGPISAWQAGLVREALGEGSTWEEVGEGLGTSRQAAWARFHGLIEPEGGVTEMEERSDLREQLRGLWEEAQNRRREADGRWREEQARLRSQVQETQRQLREARLRHSAEKRAAREELRRSADALRSALSGSAR